MAVSSSGTLELASVEPDTWEQMDPWEQIKKLVLDNISSANSKRSYEHALEDFRQWWEQAGMTCFTDATVQAYRVALEERDLAPSLINMRLSALRKLAEEAADHELLSADRAAAILRVNGVKRLGMRVGNWFGRTQAQDLLTLPNRHTNHGRRDRVILALLVGARVRPEELALLDVKTMQEREGRWHLVDLRGKENRIRTVPIPGWTKIVIDEWLAATGFTSGLLLARISKGDKIVSRGLSAQAIYEVARYYAEKLKAL